MSRGRERTILPKTLILEEIGEGFLSNALCITGIAALPQAVTGLFFKFTRDFMIATVKTGFE